MSNHVFDATADEALIDFILEDSSCHHPRNLKLYHAKTSFDSAAIPISGKESRACKNERIVGNSRCVWHLEPHQVPEPPKRYIFDPHRVEHHAVEEHLRFQTRLARSVSLLGRPEEDDVSLSNHQVLEILAQMGPPKDVSLIFNALGIGLALILLFKKL